MRIMLVSSRAEQAIAKMKNPLWTNLDLRGADKRPPRKGLLFHRPPRKERTWSGPSVKKGLFPPHRHLLVVHQLFLHFVQQRWRPFRPVILLDDQQLVLHRQKLHPPRIIPLILTGASRVISLQKVIPEEPIPLQKVDHQPFSTPTTP